MKVTITQKTAALFVSKDDQRPTMQGMYYDAEHKALVATNGHILTVVPVEDGLTESCIIPITALPAKAGNSSDIQLIGGELQVEKWDKNGGYLGSTTVPPITGQFPPWHKLFAESDTKRRELTSHTALNPKQLVAFSLLAKNLGLNDEYIKLTFHGSEDMCRVDLEPRYEEDNVYGLIAPFTRQP